MVDIKLTVSAAIRTFGGAFCGHLVRLGREQLLMRFSIRDLMFVTVIVGLILGWSLDHRRQVELARQIDVLMRANKELARRVRVLAGVEKVSDLREPTAVDSHP